MKPPTQQRKKLLIGRYEVVSADLQREAHAQHERSMNQTDVVGRHQLQNILLADIEQLADPTELLGRKIAGKMDMAMSVCLPLIYAIMIGFLLGGCDIKHKPFEGVATDLSFDNTTAYMGPVWNLTHGN